MIGDIKYYGKNSSPNPYNYHLATVMGVNGSIHIQEIGKLETLRVANNTADTHRKLHKERRAKIKKYQKLVDSGKISLNDALDELGLRQ